MAIKPLLLPIPDMSRVKPSKLQKVYRNKFKDAVMYAKKISRDPALKKEYMKKIKPGESVYHFALKEYFKKLKAEK